MKHTEALQAPCSQCQSAPCCIHPQLFSFQIVSLIDLDQAMYFSNFSNIQLTLSSNWLCTVYLYQRCTHLTDDNNCLYHDKPQQPKVCQNYNAYKCYYKGITQDKNAKSDFVIWMNNLRWREITSSMEFTDDRNIANYLAWPKVLEAIEKHPWQAITGDHATNAKDKMIGQWEDWISNGRLHDELPKAEFNPHSPCTSCEAWCCTHLSFPLNIPSHFRDIDYIKYLLNYPSIQIGISDNAWFIVVQTTCQYLDDNKCSLFGKEQRPITCRYYPEQNCSYLATIGSIRPKGYLRLEQRHMEIVEQTLQYNEAGAIIARPQTDSLREYIEDHIRSNSELGVLA